MEIICHSVAFSTRNEDIAFLLQRDGDSPLKVTKKFSGVNLWEES